MFQNPKFRAAIYALGAAILAVLGIYGLATQEQTAAWLTVLSALLPVLAFAFVDRGGDQ